MTKNPKFKVGDKVRLIEKYASWQPDYTFTVTSISKSSSDDDGGMINGSDGICVFGRRLELAEKSLDNLQVGDILVHTDGDEAKVLAVLGNVFLRSEWNDFDKSFEWYTVAEAKMDSWTVKQDSPAPETTELSVAELEEKLGIESGTLRVKKD